MLHRRQFLAAVSLGTGALLISPWALIGVAAKEDSAVRPEMTLCVQTWTFRLFEIDQAIQKTREAGVDTIEIAGGIKIKGENKRASKLDAEQRKWLRSVLEENQVRAVSLGGSQGSVEEFDFAADMGLKVMQGEPPFEKLPEVSRRAEEYNIRFALHNHATPNRYWNYKETLKRLDGCSSWIGFCPDTGHMMRSAIDPLTAIKDLKGRIFSIHLKDLNDVRSENEPNKGLHDMPWGTGKGNVASILKELKEQKFHGPVIIEYEYNWKNNVGEVARCAEFFRETMASIES